MKFSIKYFSSKYKQIRRKLRISSHLLDKSLMKNFIFLCSEYVEKTFCSGKSNKTNSISKPHDRA